MKKVNKEAERRAANKWVKVEVQAQKGGFMVANSSVLEGVVVSVGHAVEHIEIDHMVLFPAVHGKVMEHSIEGKKYYFVDEAVILEYRK